MLPGFAECRRVIVLNVCVHARDIISCSDQIAILFGVEGERVKDRHGPGFLNTAKMGAGILVSMYIFTSHNTHPQTALLEKFEGRLGRYLRLGGAHQLLFLKRGTQMTNPNGNKDRMEQGRSFYPSHKTGIQSSSPRR